MSRVLVCSGNYFEMTFVVGLEMLHALMAVLQVHISMLGLCWYCSTWRCIGREFLHGRKVLVDLSALFFDASQITRILVDGQLDAVVEFVSSSAVRLPRTECPERTSLRSRHDVKAQDVARVDPIRSWSND
ncbi:hypothetical protein MRB53_038441 [Persea americana]|nr:hypothetical protein MRB53_038441 [Persea americana]